MKYPNVVLGLSDHTHGHASVAGAIALGARVIEKHFTDDNGRNGPDHKFAMNPKTWREMVSCGDEVLLSLGDGIKRIEPNEEKTAVVQRRSLRFTKNLPLGHILTENDLFPLRPIPEDGIAPHEISKLLGEALTADVKSDEHIRWSDVGGRQ